MTYPDNPMGLNSIGEVFTAEGRNADKTRQRLAGIGMEWFRNCQNIRVQQERQWYLNLAFYYGNQYVQFKQVQGGAYDLYTPKVPYYRVQLVINHIRKIIRKEMSRLIAQKPNAFVIPSSTEEADVFAAQAGEQIWDSLQYRLKYNKILRNAVFWQAVCGNGYLKSYWDPTKIDPSQDPANNLQGDICVEAISPFHIFVPDLMSEEIEGQPYVIHAQVRSNSWIKNNLKVEPQSANLDSVDEGLQNVMRVHRNDSKKDQSIILEIWVKPGYLPELPQGGIFTIAGNQVVQGYDSWPYEHNNYPFAKLDSIPAGKYYSTSVIEDLIPIQKELNRTRGQMVEAKNRMAKPQLLAQKGSVDARKITTEPGQVIEYTPGMDPPQPLPLQNIPSYVSEEIDRLYSDLSDLSGQHDVSNGSTPPGVTAATAISFLQEQDESLSAPHYTSIEEATEKVASQCLTYVKMYWDEGRTIKIVGIEGTFDVQTFKGADLRGNNDIRVEAGSALPTSRAAKQAFIMDLMKMGFVDPNEGLELMEVGGLNRLYERLQVDKRQAQRENLKLRVISEQDVQQHTQAWMANNPEVTKSVDEGVALNPPLIIPVHTYDNHDIHIEMHNMYRKSQNFEAASSFTKALFEEHVRQHQEASANALVPPVDLQNDSPDQQNAAPPGGAPEDNPMTMNNNPPPSSNGNTGPVPMPDLQTDNSGGGSGG